MIELSDEQRRQLQSGKAVEIADHPTAEVYVILRKDIYEKDRSLLGCEAEWTEEDLRSLLARSAKDNGWNGASMDAYDCYDEACFPHAGQTKVKSPASG